MARKQPKLPWHLFHMWISSTTLRSPEFIPLLNRTWTPHQISLYTSDLSASLRSQESWHLGFGGDCCVIAVPILQSAQFSLCWSGNPCSAEFPTSTCTPCISLKALAKGAGDAEGSCWEDGLVMFSNWRDCVTNSRGDVTQILGLGCVYKSL